MILHHIPMTMRYESLRTYENVYDYKFVQTLSDPTEHGFHAFCQNGIPTGKDFCGKVELNYSL